MRIQDIGFQEFQTAMVKAYVPEADTLDFVTSYGQALERDRVAAEELAMDGETQLHIEEAAAVINDTLDQVPDSTFDYWTLLAV